MKNKRCKNLGEKLSKLAKISEISQTELADQVGVPPSQINRFFRGKSDICSSLLVKILKELEFDVESLIDHKLNKLSDIEKYEPNSLKESVGFLFNELDDLGKQTYLNNLLWAAKVSKPESLPLKVEEKIKQQLSLI